MGHLLTYFQNQEAEDMLDRLEADIKKVEQDIRRQYYHEKRNSKRCMITFVIISVIYLTYTIYILAKLHYLKWPILLLLLIPLVIIFLIYKGFRAAISHYYSWVHEEKKSKWNNLRKEKKKKLDDVKNTAVYAKAKMILDKYDVPEEEPLICDEYDD